jgi:hypothetical protein
LHGCSLGFARRPADAARKGGLRRTPTRRGIVGDRTWSVSLHAASATLETQVGLQYVIG